jgi:hypothetical protein
MNYQRINLEKTATIGLLGLYNLYGNQVASVEFEKTAGLPGKIFSNLFKRQSASSIAEKALPQLAERAAAKQLGKLPDDYISARNLLRDRATELAALKNEIRFNQLRSKQYLPKPFETPTPLNKDLLHQTPESIALAKLRLERLHPQLTRAEALRSEARKAFDKQIELRRSASSIAEKAEPRLAERAAAIFRNLFRHPRL